MKILKSASFVIAFVFAFCFNAQCQEIDSSEYLFFKRYVPYTIKHINTYDKSKVLENTRVRDSKYVTPWDLKTISDDEINTFVEKLKTETKISVKEGRGEYSNINLVCNLQDFRVEPTLRKEFQNIIVEISEFNLLNENSEDIYLAERNNILQPSSNGVQKTGLQGAQFNALVPIFLNYTSINGSVKLTIKEKKDFVYKEFSKDVEAKEFELNGQTLELVHINFSQAIFRSNKKLSGLKIHSTDVNNFKHTQSSIAQLPAAIYDLGLKEDLSDEEIKSFIDNFSYEDFINEEQDYILIYESSGMINSLFVYFIGEMEERGSCTLDIKL